jgi:hypothetical protein
MENYKGLWISGYAHMVWAYGSNYYVSGAICRMLIDNGLVKPRDSRLGLLSFVLRMR